MMLTVTPFIRWIMPTSRNIEHYKLLSVHEQPLDNRQRYLNVLCFPILFPTGKYGEFHPHSVKLTFSEYIKSRLMNTDSRFCKNPEFVFYYLWQKKLRELSSGIYNVLKSALNLGIKCTTYNELLGKRGCTIIILSCCICGRQIRMLLIQA